MIHVDESIHPFHGKLFCHMWSDVNQEELHAFAEQIGVKRCWFEPTRRKGWAHYDINPDQRARAVAAGAIEEDRYAAFEHVLTNLGQWNEAWKKRLEFFRNAQKKGASAGTVSSERLNPSSDTDTAVDATPTA